MLRLREDSKRPTRLSLAIERLRDASDERERKMLVRHETTTFLFPEETRSRSGTWLYQETDSLKVAARGEGVASGLGSGAKGVASRGEGPGGKFKKGMLESLAKGLRFKM